MNLNYLFVPIMIFLAITIIILAGLLYQKLEDEFVLWLRGILKINTADNAKLYRQPIMTETESKFYDFLIETIGNQYLIETRKPLAQIFKRQGNLHYDLWTMYKQGHVDFLFIDRKTKNPILGIELDDWTHNRTNRQSADRRKDELFKRADMKLIRLSPKNKYGDQERAAILTALPEQFTHNR